MMTKYFALIELFNYLCVCMREREKEKERKIL